MTTHDIFHYIRRRIAEAQVIDYPFPHLCISNFFPEPLYRRLLEHFPSLPRDHASCDDTSGIDLLAPTGDGRLTAAQRELWLPVRDVIYPKALEMLEHKLEGLIEERIAELDSLDFFHHGRRPRLIDGKIQDAMNGFQLLERTEKFAIGAHIHAPSEYLSLLHYLPEDDSKAFAGTEIYPVLRTLRISIPWHEYPLVPARALGDSVSVPFVPNLALVWISTFRAVHGRSPSREMPIRRYVFGYRMINAESVDWGVLNPDERGPLKVQIAPYVSPKQSTHLLNRFFKKFV